MTRPLYHLTILPPPLSGTEAVSQEVAALQARFGGELVYLNPNRRLPLPLPRLAFGWQMAPRLRALETSHTLHHIFNPDPFPFPILKILRRPTLYTLTGGIIDAPSPNFFSKLAMVVVMDERSWQTLRNLGLQNVSLVRPGINTMRFVPSPPPPLEPMRLLAGSAPWTEAQFASKGVNILLEAARQNANLHLVFLWRGVLWNEMMKRVRTLGLERQVTIINKRVDVNSVLATVHAAVALSTDARIIKPYPRSLLESLAAGRPVLVSPQIPMADYVTQRGCGLVVESVSTEGVLTAVEMLTANYAQIQTRAQAIGARDFSQEAMVSAYGQLYQTIEQ
ncbi:MAG: glycosyltransferase [Chloroflexi bacterium]|nr:MAG: glycosyltransferase [Chloroflexota bacterium]